MSSQDSGDWSISAISKMKVPEIKKELKTRGLSTAGSKTELVERLKAATCDVAQDAMSEDGNAESEILDEDEVLGGVEESGEFDEDELTAAEADLADEPKTKTPPTPAPTAVKRSAAIAAEPSEGAQPKKRILVRPPSVLCEKENTLEVKGTKTEKEKETIKADNMDGKRVVKLTGVTLKDRLELRAQKFGVPLSEAAKKEVRAARFGSESDSSKSSKPTKLVTATKIVVQGATEDLLKKRAERFGSNVSSLAVKVEEQEKMKKRLEKFGLSAATTNNVEEKKKFRAERFKL